MTTIIEIILDGLNIKPLVIKEASPDVGFKEVITQIKTYRGFTIYCYPGEYTKTHYGYGIVSGISYVSGHENFGAGVFVQGDEKVSLPNDHSISYYSWVRTGGKSDKYIKKGVAAAVKCIEEQVDEWFAFNERERHKYDEMGHTLQVIRKSNKGEI